MNAQEQFTALIDVTVDTQRQIALEIFSWAAENAKDIPVGDVQELIDKIDPVVRRGVDKVEDILRERQLAAAE